VGPGWRAPPGGLVTRRSSTAPARLGAGRISRMRARRGKGAAWLATGLAVLAVGARMLFNLDWIRPEYRLHREFEGLGKNPQGYRVYRHRQTGIRFVRLPGGRRPWNRARPSPSVVRRTERPSSPFPRMMRATRSISPRGPLTPPSTLPLGFAVSCLTYVLCSQEPVYCIHGYHYKACDCQYGRTNSRIHLPRNT
jgi:hypothetical protein